MARSSVGSRHADDGTAVLGRGARVRGRVHGTGDLEIAGVVEGDVQLSGALRISDGGSVQGEVEAERVVVGGELLGNVSARSEVAISAGARLIGDVSASDLDLEEGAVFSGRVEMDFELPAELRAAG